MTTIREDDGAWPAWPVPAQELSALGRAERVHRVAADALAVRQQLGLGGPDHISAGELLRAARHLGWRARRVRCPAIELQAAGLPALAPMRNGEVLALLGCDGDSVCLQRLAEIPLAPTTDTLAAFALRWCGELIVLDPCPVAASTGSRPHSRRWWSGLSLRR